MAQISETLYNSIVVAYVKIKENLDAVESGAREALMAIVDVNTATYGPDQPSVPSVDDENAALEIELALLSPFNAAYVGSKNVSSTTSFFTNAILNLNNFVIVNSSFSGTATLKLDDWINTSMDGFWTDENGGALAKCPALWKEFCTSAGYNTDAWDVA